MALTWTPQGGAPSAGVTATIWNKILWVPALGKYFAVGSGGPATSTANMMSSPDGVTWTTIDPGFQKGYNEIAYSPALGMLVAFSALSFTAGTSIHVITISTNGGASWTEVDIPQGSGAAQANNTQYRGLTWIGGTVNKFVAVGQNVANPNQVLTSANGTVWTASAAPVARTWNSVAYSPASGVIVAVGGTSSQSNNVMTSTDAATWTARTTPVNARATSPGRAITCGAGTFVMLADVNNGATAADRAYPWSSVDDGVTWIQHAKPAGMDSSSHVIYGERFVAVHASASPNPSMESPDGLTWSATPDPGGIVAASWASVAYAPASQKYAALLAGVTGGPGGAMTAPSASASLTPATGPGGGGTLITFTHD